jgi:glycerol-3-phosphate O-acyltransferase
MIEGKAYLAELSGDDKKSETLFSSIRSFFSIRGFYGRVTTNFGEAILLNDILDQHDPDWTNQPYDDKRRPEWLKSSVQQVSQLIMQRINECCDVNAVNLIATALLASPNQTMDEGELKRTLNFYIKLIKNLNYSDRITLTTLTADEQIQHAEALGMVKRRKHEMGDFIYLDNAHAVRLTYYRNNILHLIALPSLIACCFNNARELDHEKIIHYIKIIYPFLKTEFFLPWSSTDFESLIDTTLNQLTAAELSHHDATTHKFSPPNISTEQHAQLATLAQVVSPLLELYYMIFALLAEHGPDTLSRERLEELCYLMAQRHSLMYEINSPDFFDKKLIANFINSLINLGYLETNTAEKLNLSEAAYKEGRHARRLLDKDMQYNILQMLRTTTSQ